MKIAGSVKTVTCPAHGSTFNLETGKVMRPPASKPVPVYDVKVEDGRVFVRPRGLRALASGLEAFVTLFEEVPAGPGLRLSGSVNLDGVDALECVHQRRSVDLIENVLTNLDDMVGSDSQDRLSKALW